MIQTPERNEHIDFSTLFLIASLCNYQKYESKNPFVLRVSSLNKDLPLLKLTHLLSSIADNCNVNYYFKSVESKSNTGLFSFVTSSLGWLGSWVSSQKKEEGFVLGKHFILCTLKFLFSNPNFIGVFFLVFYELTNLCKRPFLDSVIELSECKLAQEDSENVKKEELLHDLFSDMVVMCSFLFNRLSTKKSVIYAKLALLILMCATEDTAFCHFLHDTKYAPSEPLEIHKKVSISLSLNFLFFFTCFLLKRLRLLLL